VIHRRRRAARHNGAIALTRPEIVALMTGADLDRVKVLPSRPAWWAEAACRGRPDLNWFPDRGQAPAAAAAKAICAGCPSAAPCLAFAIEEHIDIGVWGGMSASERRRARGGAVRQPKASPVGANRWRERPPVLDNTAAQAKRAG
jgi:WhiB family transcriptional regulator, redox-sensing transcriptional regulator